MGYPKGCAPPDPAEQPAMLDEMTLPDPALHMGESKRTQE